MGVGVGVGVGVTHSPVDTVYVGHVYAADVKVDQLVLATGQPGWPIQYTAALPDPNDDSCTEKLLLVVYVRGVRLVNPLCAIVIAGAGTVAREHPTVTDVVVTTGPQPAYTVSCTVYTPLTVASNVNSPPVLDEYAGATPGVDTNDHEYA